MLKKIINFFRDNSSDQLNDNSIEKQQPASHVHDWELISKLYATPRQLPSGITTIDYGSTQALLGLTTFIWQCGSCHISKKDEAFGTDENQLIDLCMRAEITPQLIKQGENSYIISKYIPTPQQPGVLPLR